MQLQIKCGSHHRWCRPNLHGVSGHWDQGKTTVTFQNEETRLGVRWFLEARLNNANTKAMEECFQSSEAKLFLRWKHEWVHC